MLFEGFHAGGWLAATHPAAQSSGISVWAVVGVVATILGVLAAAQQFLSAFLRRKFNRAEERWLESITADEEINASLKLKEQLGDQIKTEIPRLARRVYLGNRLDQLTEDLHRTYREYQYVRGELAKNEIVTELDQRILDAVRASISSRSFSESRNVYMLVLIVLLLAYNIAPLGLGNVFGTLARPDYYFVWWIVIVFLYCTACLTLAVLIAASFVPREGNGRWRMRIKIPSVKPIWKAVAGWTVVASSAALLAGGFLERNATINYGYTYFNGHGPSSQLASENFFVFAIVITSLWLAIFIFGRRHQVHLATRGERTSGK
jgi:hypothetical protein